MKNRLKELRQSLDMNQDEFAKKLGVGRSTIANYEAGTREPVSSIVSLICDRFGVSEKWLRTGEGRMDANVGENDEIQRLLRGLKGDNSAEVKRRLVTAILNLDAKQIEAGISWMKQTLAIATAADQADTTAANAKNPIDMTTEEKVEDFRAQLVDVEEGKSTAVQDTASGSFG